MPRTAVYIAACPDVGGTAVWKVGAVIDTITDLLASLPSSVEVSIWPCDLSSTADLLSWFSAITTPRPDLGADFFEGQTDEMKDAMREYIRALPATAVRRFCETHSAALDGCKLEEVFARFEDYARGGGWSVTLDLPAFAGLVADVDSVSLVLTSCTK